MSEVTIKDLNDRVILLERAVNRLDDIRDDLHAASYSLELAKASGHYISPIMRALMEAVEELGMKLAEAKHERDAAVDREWELLIERDEATS